MLNRRMRLLLIAGSLTALLGASAGCQDRSVTVSDGPVDVLEETTGRGRAAEPGDIVRLKYRGYLPDGTEILKDDDLRFKVGNNSVITGIDEGVTGMREQGRRVITCPPRKHWGRPGHGPIPPNTILTFELELKAIE